MWEISPKQASILLPLVSAAPMPMVARSPLLFWCYRVQKHEGPNSKWVMLVKTNEITRVVSTPKFEQSCSKEHNRGKEFLTLKLEQNSNDNLESKNLEEEDASDEQNTPSWKNAQKDFPIKI